MTSFSTWKTIGYAVAIFAAGGISGGALGIYHGRQTAALQPPQDDEIPLRMRTRLQVRLQLTPDQVKQIDPVIDKMATDLHTVRRNTMDQVGKVFEDAYNQIAAVLTPGQKVKLDEIIREHRAAMQRRRWGQGPGGGGPHPDGGPPHPDRPELQPIPIQPSPQP